MHHDLYPRRIVSLQPSATVTLASLGCLDLVVACTKYCLDVVPELRDSPRKIVADSWTANRNEILAAQPDFVVASVPYQLDAVADILKAGVRFLGLAPHSLSEIYTDIMTIAGVGEEWGKPLIASQGWVKELVEAAGGEFIGEPGKQVTPEAIYAADPDVLVAAWCGAGDRVPLEKIVAQRGWRELRAVRKGRVYCIPDECLNTPAPTLLQGLYALAAALHPSLFPESLVPRAIRATPLPVPSQENTL